DPEEGPLGLVDQLAAAGDLLAGGAEQGTPRARLVRGEEDAVAGGGADVGGEARLLLLGDVLRDRTAELAVLTDGDIGQALGAALLGPLLPGVELPARLGGAAGHDDRTDVVRREDAEGGLGEELGAVDQLDTEAQVRLVAAVALHGLAELDDVV